MKTTLSFIAIFTCLMGANASAAAAKGTPAQQTATAKTQLDEANKALTEAHKKHDTVEKGFKTAEDAHKKSAAKVQDARLAATREFGGKLGLGAAQATDAAARREADAAQTALIAEIKKQPDYLAATKEAGEASAKLRTVRDDTSLSDEQRQKKSSELSALIRRPAEIEKEKLASDPGLKKMLTQVAEAAAKLAAVRQEVQLAIAGDASVKAATDAAKKSDTDFEKEKGDLAKVQKEVTTAQAKVTTEIQQYQRAVTADQKKKK